MEFIETIERIYGDLPASYGAIKVEDNIIFLLSETSKLDIRPQIVQPS